MLDKQCKSFFSLMLHYCSSYRSPRAVAFKEGLNAPWALYLKKKTHILTSYSKTLLDFHVA